MAMSFTALADTKIRSVSLRIKSNIEAGTYDTDVDITTSSNKYSVEDYEVTNEPVGNWDRGDKPRLKVVLTAEDGYYFGSGFSKSDVSLTGDGGTVSSVSRSGTGRLNVTVTLDALDDGDGGYGLEVYDLEWDEDNGEASWEEAEDARKYEVRLYRNGSSVTSGTTSSASYDFGKYFTKKGTYTFKVRGVYSSSYKGEWKESDELYVSSSEADDIRDAAKDSSGSYQGSGSSGPGVSSGGGPGSSGGSFSGAWLKDGVGWWYCNADRSYPVNQWQYINDYWYFFNAQGYMVTGWVYWNNVWYYCSDSGAMLTNATTPDGYRVDANGAWIQ